MGNTVSSNSGSGGGGGSWFSSGNSQTTYWGGSDRLSGIPSAIFTNGQDRRGPWGCGDDDPMPSSNPKSWAPTPGGGNPSSGRSGVSSYGGYSSWGRN